MKRPCVLVCLVLLGLSAASEAHDSYLVDLTCPICELQFGVGVTGNYSMYGNEDEGRPKTYFNVVEASIFYCPRCHYSGRLHVFKSKEDKYFKLDLPNAKQVKAIKAYLKGRKDLPPPKDLYPVEYFDIAAHCLTLRQAKPVTMLNMYLMCAWMCDDAGEDALAAKYRTRALAASKQSMSDKTLTLSDRLWRRRLQSIIADNLGRHAEALKDITDLHAEIEKLVETRRKLLPPKPKDLGKTDRRMPYRLRDSDGDDGALFDTGEKPLDPKTKAKLRKVWQAWLDVREFEDVLSPIKYSKTKLQYKMLGATKAAALAKKGKYPEKYAFFEVFRSSNAPQVASAMETFIADPVGKRPKEYDDKAYEWEDWETKARERLLSCLTREAETSAKLRKLAKMLESKYSAGGDEDDEYKSAMQMLRKASITFLLKDLEEKRKKEDPIIRTRRPLSEGIWYPADDIVAELIRRQDKKTAAALTSDFARNLSWYAGALTDLREYIFPETKKDTMERDFSWAYPTETTEYFAPFYKAIARDPKLAAAVARRLVRGPRTAGEIVGTDGVVGVMPLAYIKTKKNRQLLVKAAATNAPAMAYAAAKCLLMRGDPAGKDAMINVIATHRQWDLPSGRAGDAFIKMLKPQDAAILPKLKKLFLDDAEYTSLLKKYKGKSDGLGLPIRLVAALTRAEPKQQGIYDAFLARFAPPAEAPKDGSWSSHFDYRHIDSLAQAARMYYRPDIGKHIARLLDRFADDEIAPMLIDALAAGGATDQLGTLAALLKRPVPVPVKAALIRASRKLDIPGMPEKLTEWSRSRNGQLAKLAKAEIARRDKTPKRQ